MFKLKKSLDNIYNLLINMVNNERKAANVNLELRRMAERNNLELTKELECKNKIIEELNNQISQLKEMLKKEETENHKIHEYLEKVAEILKNNQTKIINRKKPTKADLMAEGMLKMDDTTKAKLK